MNKTVMKQYKRAGFITAAIFLMFLTACGGGGSGSGGGSTSTPAPRPGPEPAPNPNVTVPNVVNQSQTAAQTAITGAGLKVGTTEEEYSSEITAGNVISQTPAANTSVASGTAVNLIISLGPEPSDGEYFGGINNSGQVVGEYFDEEGRRKAFLRDGDVETELSPPGATGDVYAFGINDSGEILLYSDSNDSYFLKDASGYAALENHTDPAARLTYYTAINSSGRFAGYYEDENGYATGFINDGTGFSMPIEHPDAYGVCAVDWPCGTWVTGLNNFGDMAGSYIDADGYFHGFVYKNGSYETIDRPESGMNTYITGINDNGYVSGYFWDETGYTRGFVYDTASDGFTDINHENAASSGEGTYVSGINNSGRATGWYDDGEKLRGFVMDF